MKKKKHLIEINFFIVVFMIIYLLLSVFSNVSFEKVAPEIRVEDYIEQLAEANPGIVTQAVGTDGVVFCRDVFPIVFVFTIIAFVLSLTLINVLFFRYGKKTEEYMLTVNQMIAVFGYLIAQLLFSFAVTGILYLSPFMVLIICLVILLLFLAVFLLGGIGRTHVQEMDDKLAKETYNIKRLREQSKDLAEQIENPELRKQVQRLVDEIRFADAVSREDLEDLEADLAQAILRLKEDISKKDESAIEEAARQAMELVQERNKRCKAGK